jgi:hypothetical protein
MFGDFPFIETSLDNYRSVSTWIDYGSYYGFETLPRYPIIALGNYLSTMNIGPEIVSKSLVVLGFLAASFSFYFSYILLFKDKLSKSVTLLKISAIIGSLFYAYNVWSFHRIAHWYLWLGYAILPLFIASLIYAFKYPNKWKYVIAAVLLWSLASSTPHMFIFYGLFYLAFSIYYVLRNIRNKRALVKVAIPILSIISFYLLVNLYWIYPSILYALYEGAGTLLPSVHVTEEMTEIFSRDSSFLNVLRLIQDWLLPKIIEVSPTQTSLLYPLWLFASFVFPTIAFSALLLKKNSKYVLLFSTIGIIGILLTLGTNAPYNLYSILLFEGALFSTFPYLFRDPDKWTFMIALAYSFLLSIASFEILKRLKKIKYKPVLASSCFILLILVSFLIYSYPAYTSTAQKLLDPVILPIEYNKLNEYLRTSNIERVFYMFQDSSPTIWNKGRDFCCVDQKTSAKPNIMIYLPTSQQYHDYIKNSILSNKSNDINNLIAPLGTSLVIYSNDELDSNNTILNRLSLLKDFKNINNIGFFKVFKAGENNNVGQIEIPKQNMIVVGGLDLFTILNSLPSFSTVNSSLFFLDQNLNKEKKYQLADSIDYLSLSKNKDDLLLSFLEEKYITSTFGSTNRDEPSDVWSKSSTGDPQNTDFQQLLTALGIENWDFDYGKGLVVTEAPGTKLPIPINIESQKENNKNTDDNNFLLFMRYLKNQKGGSVRIHIDDKLVKEFDTLDRISNTFVWERVAPINLTNGKHTLTLENIAGLNAVNVFALIPSSEMNRLNKDTAQLFTEKSRIIYPLEAETNFYNIKGRDSNSSLYLFDSNNSSTDDTNGNANRTFTGIKSFEGQFQVPVKNDLVGLQFLTRQDSSLESSFSVKDIKITPAHKRYNVLTSDYEKTPIHKATLNQSNWSNTRKDILTTSIEANRPIYGNNSLKVDIEQGNFPYWGTISTDFIPVNDGASYNYTLDVSAKDVNQLHSKVFYYDSTKKEIKWDFVFAGRDGSFKQRFNEYIIPPIGTKYIKLQLWVASNPKVQSSYLLDNVELEEILTSAVNPRGTNSWLKNGNPETEQIMFPLLNTTRINSDDGYNENINLLTGLKKGNSNHSQTIVTKSFPVEENHLYNYTIIVEAKNAQFPSIIASFKNSGDVVQNLTRYGNNASKGGVLTLGHGSEINTNLDVLKAANYTIAVRAKTCETCTFLEVRTQLNDENNDINYTSKTSNISLKDKESGLRWLYSNSTVLKQGTYNLQIYSDSQTDLDSVIVFETGNTNTSMNNNKKSNEALDLFNQTEIPSPAQISEYKKINPTKYILSIINASRPYIISFAEAYDPLWIAHTNDYNNKNSNENNNFRTNSIPLYSVVNGFFINKTGDYNLTIEYLPQKWFTEAGILSLLAFIGLFAISFVYKHWASLRKSKILSGLKLK